MNKLTVRFVLTGLSVVIALLAPAPWSSSSSAQAGTQTNHGALNRMQYDYAVTEDGNGNFVVTYQYPRNSKEDIALAADSLNQAAAQFATDGAPFKATLVFKQPLASEEFRALIHKADLAPTGSIMRGVGTDGDVVKLGVPPVWARDGAGHPIIGKPDIGGNPLDTDGLARFITGKRQVRPIGVISTDVVLDGNMFAQVRQDAHIYTIDVMQQVLLNMMREKYPDVSRDKIQIQWSILYPALERTSIAPKVTP
ncbi:MAG: hypothetical protein M1570_16485 [Chloroflexi bacterium]|nr:hypothetical protein [Chloroflexota bacterium]